MISAFPPHRRTRSRVVTAVGLFAAVVGVGTMASAAPAATSWRPAQNLASGSVESPLLALAPNGQAVAAWLRTGIASSLQASLGRLGHPWGKPRTISRGAAGGFARGQVAIAPTGAAAMVWQESLNGVWVAFRPAGKNWEAPRLLHAGAYWPQIGFDAAGNATMTWWWSGVIQAVTRPAGGNWGPVQDVATTCFCADQNPRLAVRADGRAVVVWNDLAGSAVMAAVRAVAGAPFAAAGMISSAPTSGLHATAARVAFDPSGRAVAIWSERNVLDPPPGVPAMARAVLSEAGVWSAPEPDTPPVSASLYLVPSATNPAMGVDRAGDEFAAWWTFDGRVRSIEASRRAAGASAWDPPQSLQVSTRNATMVPALAVSSRGDAIVLWQRREGRSVAIRSAFRPAGAPAWNASEVAAQPAPLRGARGFNYTAFPQVVFDRIGNALAAWSECAGAGCVVRTAVRPR